MKLSDKRLLYIAAQLSLYVSASSLIFYNGLDILFSSTLQGMMFLTAHNLSVKTIQIKKQVTNTVEGKELLMCYNKVLENISNMCKKNNITEPIDIYDIFLYLYMAHNKQAKFHDIEGMLALDVINGKGLCRHLASFLTELYLYMGYNAYSLILNVSYDEEYKKSYDNHLVTIVEYKGYLYILDPTREDIMYIDNNNLQYIHSKSANVQYKVLNKKINKFDNGIDIKEFEEMLLLKHYGAEMLKKKFSESLDKLILFYEDLYYFYENNKHLYEYISSLLEIPYLNYEVSSKLKKKG